jgi:hypothetical protein
MAALNVARHIRRLVARKDRLTRETASKQRQLDTVLGQLARIQAALPADPTEARQDVLARLHRFAVVDAGHDLPSEPPVLPEPELPASWKPFTTIGGAL